MAVSLLSQLLLLLIAATCNGQFQYRNNFVNNHGYAELQNLDQGLRCRSNERSCCLGGADGSWVKPDGMNVTTNGVDVNQSYYSESNNGYITLFPSDRAMSGIYKCIIKTSQSRFDSYYIGIYRQNEVEMNHSVDISLVVEPDGNKFQYTFMCITTGFPVGYFYWYRDSKFFKHSIPELRDRIRSKYISSYSIHIIRHTTYACRPQDSLANSFDPGRKSLIFDVSGVGNMTYTQTGIRRVQIYWNLPSSRIDSHIIYQQIGSDRIERQEVDLSLSTTATINGLMIGSTYSVYIANTESTPHRVKAMDVIEIGETIINFRITSHSSSISLGDNVTLTCNVVPPSVVTGSIAYEITSSKYNVRKYWLDVSNIELDDVETYSCYGTLGGVITAYLTIPPIQIPQPVVSITASRSTPIYEGTYINLTCTVTLDRRLKPPHISVDITWSYSLSRSTISETHRGLDGRYTSILSISPLVAPNDNGYYHCTAHVNGAKIQYISASNWYGILLVALPSPMMMIYGDWQGTAGDSLQLTCSVTTVEHLAIFLQAGWYYDYTVDNMGIVIGTETIIGATHNRTLLFNPLKTTHVGKFTCRAVTNRVTWKNSNTVRVKIPTPSVELTQEDTEISATYPLTLTCTASPQNVDTATYYIFHWTTPTGNYDRVSIVNDTLEDQLIIPNTDITDSGFYICSVSVADTSGNQFIEKSNSGESFVSITIRPNSAISYTYSPVKGEDPEILGLNEFTAGSKLVLNCSLRGEGDVVEFKWYRTNCYPDCILGEESTLVLGGPPLNSSSGGSYTCVINGGLISRPFTVTVVGAGLYGDLHSSLQSGPIPDHGLVVSGATGMRLICVSDSNQNGIGKFTTPDGTILSSGDTSTVWSISSSIGGAIVLETRSILTSSEQGIYTCSIPDSTGELVVLNIGIYPLEYNRRLIMERSGYFYSNGSCGHVICISSGSPATNVIWMKNGRPLSTNSTLYSTSQIITDRHKSTYTNVLSIVEDVEGNYSCEVSNKFGSVTADIIIDSGCDTDIFTVEPGEREVTLTWCPPEYSDCSTTFPSYTLSCSPPPPRLSLPHTLTLLGMVSINGFNPGTSYTCSLKSVEEDEMFSFQFTTMTDFTEFELTVSFLDVHTKEPSSNNCSSIIAQYKEEIIKEVTERVVNLLKEKQCTECSENHLKNQTLECRDEQPLQIKFNARLYGTADNDSQLLVSAIDDEYVNGLKLPRDKYLKSPEREKNSMVGAAVSGVMSVIVIVTVVSLVIVWRVHRKYRQKKNKSEQLAKEGLPRPPKEDENIEIDYSYILMEKLEKKETEGKAVAMETTAHGMSESQTGGGVAGGGAERSSPGRGGGGEGSGGGSPIGTSGNTAYLEIGGNSRKPAASSEYVEMPCRQKALSVPMETIRNEEMRGAGGGGGGEGGGGGGGRFAVTGIRTAPNAAYYEISIPAAAGGGGTEEEDITTGVVKPSEPLYEQVGDFSVFKDRAKRSVHKLIKSLPRHVTPSTRHVTPPTNNTTHASPSEPNTPAPPLPIKGKSEATPTIEEGAEATTTTEEGSEATPTQEGAEATPKATPTVDDSPMRNRPPLPLPDDAESSTDEEELVYDEVTKEQ